MPADQGKPGRPCTVCQHPARDEINKAIVLKAGSNTVEVKILEAPQWVQLRAILVEVFNAHPAAGAAFLEKTRHLKLLDA